MSFSLPCLCVEFGSIKNNGDLTLSVARGRATLRTGCRERGNHQISPPAGTRIQG